MCKGPGIVGIMEVFKVVGSGGYEMRLQRQTRDSLPKCAGQAKNACLHPKYNIEMFSAWEDSDKIRWAFITAHSHCCTVEKRQRGPSKQKQGNRWEVMAVVQGRVDSRCPSGCGEGDGNKEGCGSERPFKGRTGPWLA